MYIRATTDWFCGDLDTSLGFQKRRCFIPNNMLRKIKMLLLLLMMVVVVLVAVVCGGGADDDHII